MTKAGTKVVPKSTRSLLEVPRARPLLRALDHGPDIRVDADTLGVTGDRWVEPFLHANASSLARLDLKASVELRGGVGVRLTPGARVGAVPLVSPTTRRVAAGLLVEPRFRWSGLGAVLSGIGFATEAAVGGAPLVPGSAREVPAWLLAAPVLRRLEALRRHLKRGFVERSEDRTSPRGRIDWSRWVREHVPAGRWASLPCHFSEPDEDPALLAAIRWTLGRLDNELAPLDEAVAARALRARVADLRAWAGTGEARRPSPHEPASALGPVTEALQAMGWVSEERGLGGSRALDGMSWDLAIEEVWEAWVDAFVAELAPRCGLVALRRGQTRRGIQWATPVASMRSLVPDSGLRGPGRLTWVDAKHKVHLQLLAQKGWSGLDDATRDAHRADLHQALAYASLDDAEQVDSVLAYPEFDPDRRATPAVATVAAGRRRVRLLLLGLPFGFLSATHRDETTRRWRDVLTT
jgi:hypothetical protein